MRNWALTTIQYNRPGDQYTAQVLPLTRPLFQDYANRHGMTFVPCEIGPEAALLFPQIPTRGTECVYASIPFRRALLDEYDGVVYLDADAVIVDPTDDICQRVTAKHPFGMVEGLTGAVQVLKSCLETKALLDQCWAERQWWGKQHWAEEGFFKWFFGYDWEYNQDVHADGGRAERILTIPRASILTILDDSWCMHPLDVHYRSERGPRIMNPGGIHPFGARLQQIKKYIGLREDLDSIRTAREG